jgi:hypothetical protein
MNFYMYQDDMSFVRTNDFSSSAQSIASHSLPNLIVQNFCVFLFSTPDHHHTPLASIPTSPAIVASKNARYSLQLDQPLALRHHVQRL